MSQVSKEEEEFYAIFPAIQYLRHRDTKVEYPPPGRGERTPIKKPTRVEYPKGWLLDFLLSTSDYEHCVVYNDITKEVIYSIKGTYWGDMGDVGSDIFTMGSIRGLQLLNQISPIIRNNIYEIAHKVIDKYKIKKRYKVIFSSHSLGATLQHILLLKNYKDAENQKQMRIRDQALEQSVNVPNNDIPINIFENVDKVYFYDPGVGIFDGLVALYHKYFINPEQQKILRKINNVFYVPYSKGDVTSLVSDRLGLENIFFGNIHQSTNKVEYLAHSLYNHVNDNVIKILEDPQKNKQYEIKSYHQNIQKQDSRQKLIDILKHDSQIIGGAINNEFNQYIYNTNEQFNNDKLIVIPIMNMFVQGYYDVNSSNYNKSLEASDKFYEFHDNQGNEISITEFIRINNLKSKILIMDKPDNMSEKNYDLLKTETFRIQPSNFNYTKEDIYNLINNNTKNQYINDIIENNKDPLIVYTMSEAKKKRASTRIASYEHGIGVQAGLHPPMNIINSSALNNPQSAIPVDYFVNFGSSTGGSTKGASSKGSSKSSAKASSKGSSSDSRGASTIYYEDIVGSMGTSTAGSVFGSRFGDIAPPDVYNRYITGPSLHPQSRASFPTETIYQSKTLYDSQGKPIVDLSGQPIITTEKITKARKPRKVIPTVKEAKAVPVKKIVNPKPKVEKPKASVPKPAKLSAKTNAVPTVPKPKKVVKESPTVKKTGKKVDNVYKL